MQAKFYYLQHQAHAMVSNAIRHGDLVPDTHCNQCGKTQERQLDAHHEDYSKPLEVTWLCQSCHTKQHPRQPRKFYRSPKMNNALSWLQQHPEHLYSNSRDLENEIGVGYGTINKAQRILRANG